MSRHSFTVACDSALEAAVTRRVAAEVEREARWWSDALAEVHAIEGAAERRAARGRLQAQRQYRRDTGKVLASRNALLRHHLREELTARGWDTRKWPPIPAGQASISGRPVGVSKHEARAGDGKGRLIVTVGAELWTRVRRATFHTSAPAVAQLQAWADRFGDGPGAAAREGDSGVHAVAAQAAGISPRAEDLRRREELRARIVTVGDLVRAAAKRATSL